MKRGRNNEDGRKIDVPRTSCLDSQDIINVRNLDSAFRNFEIDHGPDEKQMMVLLELGLGVVVTSRRLFVHDAAAVEIQQNSPLVVIRFSSLVLVYFFT